MTSIDSDWLKSKKLEAIKVVELFGEQAKYWDVTNFLRIIDDQAREIRRLTTELGIKK